MKDAYPSAALTAIRDGRQRSMQSLRADQFLEIMVRSTLLQGMTPRIADDWLAWF